MVLSTVERELHRSLFLSPLSVFKTLLCKADITYLDKQVQDTATAGGNLKTYRRLATEALTWSASVHFRREKPGEKYTRLSSWWVSQGPWFNCRHCPRLLEDAKVVSMIMTISFAASMDSWVYQVWGNKKTQKQWSWESKKGSRVVTVFTGQRGQQLQGSDPQ